MSRWTKIKGGWVIAAVALIAASCTEEPSDPAVFFQIRSEGWTDSIDIWVKQYHDDGDVTVRRLEPLRIEEDREGYLTGRDDGDPLRVRIDLPAAGRYAFHLVSTPLAGTELADGTLPEPTDRLVETRCLDVRGEVIDRSVVLALLTRDDDSDGDTFPEDTGWCESRRERGLPCDEECGRPSFFALYDCNPEGDPPLTCDPDPRPGPEPAAWNPFAQDQCGDCLDEDCYGGDAPCQDRDGDGFPGGEDCNDDDPEIHPGAEEICGNGIDENCWIDVAGCDDGDLPCDADGDGAYEQVSETCGTDCDDDNPDVNPRQIEGCLRDDEGREQCYGCDDELDNNCDGRVNEGCHRGDLDNDGVPFRDPETGDVLDCNDCNSAVGPAFATVCGNGVDEDCDGDDEPCDPDDGDGDGFRAFDAGGSDCDDRERRTFPGAPDYCGDGTAQSCGLDVDCDDITDNDGDRFGLGEGDCDDTNLSIHPWAEEICDPLGADEDCDGLINEVPSDDADTTGCGYDPERESWFPIDFTDDMEHCGGCWNVCCPTFLQCAGDVCFGGQCRCSGAEGVACEGRITDTCCPDGCADLTSDVNNCGGCGASSFDFICARNEECVPGGHLGLGECRCPGTGGRCTGGEWSACCPEGCTDLATDPRNCGRCGDDCVSSRRGDICALSSSDRPVCYCGSVGVRCEGSEWCTEVTEPPRDRPSCGCADLDNDEDHCGACHISCRANEQCHEGQCRCRAGESSWDSCGEDEVCCPGTGCADLSRDSQNCGGCGRECNPGETCSRGSCICGDCDDGNPCTQGGCHRHTNRCFYETLDADDDGYCAPGCRDDAPLTAPGDCIDDPSDCNDSNDLINPGRPEDCRSDYDDDCDGETNELDALGCTPFFRDDDRDGYGTEEFECYCSAYSIYRAEVPGDCDDRDDTIHPGADELCDGVDNDCDDGTHDGASDCTDPWAPHCVEGDCICGPEGEPCLEGQTCCSDICCDCGCDHLGRCSDC